MAEEIVVRRLAVMLGSFTGAFAVTLLLPAIWLIICKVVPALRPRIRGSYGIAIALCFVPVLVTYGGPTARHYVSAVVWAAVLLWQMRRAEAKARATMEKEVQETRAA